MSVFDHVASATVRVSAGNSAGSGFHVLSPLLVVTNHHVVEGHSDVIVSNEAGSQASGRVVSVSNKPDEDWAVVSLSSALPSPAVLEIAANRPRRGDRVIFAGFPHGLSDLLTHVAHVSGPYDSRGFHLDGSVNGGNSGGPVVDATSGELLGIVTQRRMMHGIELGEIAKQGDILVKSATAQVDGIGVAIMGIDIGELYQHIGQSSRLARDVAIANANTGIGIAFFPDAAVESARAV